MLAILKTFCWTLKGQKYQEKKIVLAFKELVSLEKEIDQSNNYSTIR